MNSQASAVDTMFDLERYLNDCKLIVVSNREPYEHVHGVGGIEVRLFDWLGGIVSRCAAIMEEQAQRSVR